MQVSVRMLRSRGRCGLAAAPLRLECALANVLTSYLRLVSTRHGRPASDKTLLNRRDIRTANIAITIGTKQQQQKQKQHTQNRADADGSDARSLNWLIASSRTSSPSRLPTLANSPILFP